VSRISDDKSAATAKVCNSHTREVAGPSVQLKSRPAPSSLLLGMRHWKSIDDRSGIFAIRYSFGGGGSATTLVAKIGDGKFLAISPGCGLSAEALDELALEGEVVALVAPNFFHYLGLPEWLKRWPKARVFAPQKSIPRLEKKCPAVVAFEPLEKLRPLLPDHVTVLEPPHLRQGEAMALLRGTAGWIWYFTDLVINLAKLPPNPLKKLVLWSFLGGTGLRVSRIAKLFVKDRPALKSWLLTELRSRQPVCLVPAHGEILKGASLLEDLSQAVRAGL
jgi:hypothetical protein